MMVRVTSVALLPQTLSAHDDYAESIFFSVKYAHHKALYKLHLAVPGSKASENLPTPDEGSFLLLDFETSVYPPVVECSIPTPTVHVSQSSFTHM